MIITGKRDSNSLDSCNVTSCACIVQLWIALRGIHLSVHDNHLWEAAIPSDKDAKETRRQHANTVKTHPKALHKPFQFVHMRALLSEI